MHARAKKIIPPQTVLVRLVKPTVPVRYVALPRNRRENQCLVGTRKSPLTFSQVRGVSESGVPGDGISGVQSSERLCDEGGVNRIEPIGFLDSCGCERGGARVWPVPRDR